MCSNPELPYFELGDTIPSGPVRCVTCGGELELVCKGSGCDAPLGERNQIRGRGIPRAGRRTYKPKPCPRCLRIFEPKGPRSLYCNRDDCETHREELVPGEQLEVPPSPPLPSFSTRSL